MPLPPRCVVDTSALVDLRIGRLLRPFLSSTVALIPDLLSDEINQGTWTEVQVWGAQVIELTREEIRDVVRLSRGKRSLSPHDFATVVLAQREGVPLLTSNFSHVPAAAGEHGVVVFGVLRVAETLVDLAVVDPPAAAMGLEAMLGGGSYLPEAECQRLIDRWRRAAV